MLFTPLAAKGVWTLRRDRRNYSVPVAGAFETDEMDVVREEAVGAGLGIGILPLYTAADALQQGQLVPLLRQFEVVPESAIYLLRESHPLQVPVASLK